MRLLIEGGVCSLEGALGAPVPVESEKAIPYTMEVWGDFLSAIRFSAKGDRP
ncbi:hypothetical protein UF75_4614 [Desulfosporosinus sp. I2]|nr:hypothetical protein UF75_4614 [Desulfosporosinus sp. I2]